MKPYDCIDPHQMGRECVVSIGQGQTIQYLAFVTTIVTARLLSYTLMAFAYGCPSIKIVPYAADVSLFSLPCRS